jgi:hypothetical protein
MNRIAILSYLGALMLGCAANVAEGEPANSESAGPEPVDDIHEDAPGSGTEDIGSVTSAACAYRSDFVSSITPGEGYWGTWAQCFEWCEENGPWFGRTYADSMNFRSESPRGSGDDTGLNGVQVRCTKQVSPGEAIGWTSASSTVAPWGAWGGFAQPCPMGQPMVAARMKIETPQGNGDDTAANRLEFKCRDGNVRSPDANSSWGTWGDWKQCPANTAICGIRTRVESSRGSGDDTALNGVELACCTLNP